jgi:ABC-2 type transport system permease protein
VQTIFWTLAFPVILVSFFAVAFSNINNATEYKTINLGIINTKEYKDDAALQSHISAATEGDNQLFAVTMYDTKEQADQAISDKQISGYILEDNTLHLTIRNTGIDQTIMKVFLDWYEQTTTSVNNILSTNPAAGMKISGILTQNITYITDTKTNTNKPDNILTYYYALIAMACLYGAFMGVREVMAVQANQSAQAARINMAPVHKLKVFGFSLCSATLIQYSSILLLVAYMAFVLKIDFGNQVGFILLASFAGCCAGVSFGAFIGAITKKGESIKTGLIISLSMIMSFLAGLMVSQIKYLAVKKFPILAYINPANLIADAFYSLYYYNTYNRYFLNVVLLFVFAFVFYLIVYLIMRRQQYESI